MLPHFFIFTGYISYYPNTFLTDLLDITVQKLQNRLDQIVLFKRWIIFFEAAVICYVANDGENFILELRVLSC